MNKIIKNLLEKSLGLNAEFESGRKKEFLDIFGVWNKSDGREFNKNLSDFKNIDKEDWQ